ncbi:MAG: hypothetical protein H6835_07475 [Planctomycetes bacterium]|nr:hypothetical protein [Planctomycetota bacterium]
MCTRRAAASLALAAVCALPACELFGGAGVRGSGAQWTTCADPDGATAWRDAQAALARGDQAAALVSLLAAIDHCPELVRAHFAYQDLARELGGEVEQAMVDRYTQAPDDGSSPLPAYLRARLADTAYAQANALQALLKRFPGFGWAWLSSARVNRGQGRLSEALVGFDRAIAVDGSLLEALLESAQVLVELGRDEEAASQFRAYLAQRPEDLDAQRSYLMLLLYRLGRVDEALQRIATLEQLGDHSVALRMDRAAALWRKGAPESAVDLYLEILGDEPGVARAALNIGLIYYEVLPRTDADRLLYWPKARAAFRMFLQRSQPSDGHEQAERTVWVPFRLRRIGELLGPSESTEPSLDELRRPNRNTRG